MTITLSVGIAVTLVGLIAVRYARRLKRRQLLNLPPGYVQVGQGRLALCPEELIGQVRALTVSFCLNTTALLMRLICVFQGCNGTMVFKGLLGSQEVAVKKMLKAFYNTADREIELLMSTNHPNVLRYFQREDFGEFIHLVRLACRPPMLEFPPCGFCGFTKGLTVGVGVVRNVTQRRAPRAAGDVCDHGRPIIAAIASGCLERL